MPRIALLQACTGIDPDANAAGIVEAIGRAAEGGATMLFTPEMSGLLDRDAHRAAANVAFEQDDRVLAACRDAARRSDIWLHLGSLAIRSDKNKFVNRGIVIDGAGEIRARYDKIHLFDVDLPTGESWRESAVYRAGSEAVVVMGTPVGTLGLTICYDLRFPVLFERLAEAGAQTIAVPAAFTVPTGRAHWDVLLRARAIEAGLFVIAAAQSGHHADGRETYGHSLVVDPWGSVALDMGPGVKLEFAEIDLASVDEIRARIPALAHRTTIAAATTH